GNAAEYSPAQEIPDSARKGQGEGTGVALDIHYLVAFFQDGEPLQLSVLVSAGRAISQVNGDFGHLNMGHANKWIIGVRRLIVSRKACTALFAGQGIIGEQRFGERWNTTCTGGTGRDMRRNEIIRDISIVLLPVDVQQAIKLFTPHAYSLHLVRSSHASMHTRRDELLLPQPDV
ncbi:MAG TPA: hypothetical protein VK667_08690, partial [Ktedonobacteraceae bacterium]|nr:hypothetical protein [Ktedonobacteraceae bacterium]